MWSVLEGTQRVPPTCIIKTSRTVGTGRHGIQGTGAVLFQPHRTDKAELPPNTAARVIPVLFVWFQTIAVHVGRGKQGSFARAHYPLPKQFFRFDRRHPHFPTRQAGHIGEPTSVALAFGVHARSESEQVNK
jgi:hypothetical protein